MERRHGHTTAFQIGDDLFVQKHGGKQELRITPSFRASDSPTPSSNSNGVFRFGRMFRNPTLGEFRPEAEGLIALGRAMVDNQPARHALNIPAGYVYFGQFVDHDLSFDKKTHRLDPEPLRPEDALNLRSPTLDLDSLYGLDPAIVRETELGKRVYEEDGVRLRVGETQIESSPQIVRRFEITTQSFPNDLPRMGDPNKKQAAAILDPRNDENLAVAQTHLAFIKFHNAVVEHLRPKVAPADLFTKAREAVVQHYQYTILKDYLPRIIDPAILNDVLERGVEHLQFGENEEPFMPVEFSVAAFRLGHSLINSLYEWNAVFTSPPKGFRPASLSAHLFSFTGFGSSNLFSQNSLPSSWIIDWRRFYDFGGFDGISVDHVFNSARRIGPSVIRELTSLEPFPGEDDPHLRILPVRSLLRGRLLGLPTGQSVARRLGLPPNYLSETAITKHHPEILKEFGFDRSTPLWYYILLEADVLNNGERLGPVGSRIVAETFVALIKRSRTSILPQTVPGQPTFMPYLGRPNREFSMAELLYFVHRTFPNEEFINPLRV